MKLRLDATPEELAGRGDVLLDALAKAVRPHSPELADALQKALPPREVELRHKALRELHARIRQAYQIRLSRMNADIAAVLEEERAKTSGTQGANVVELPKGKAK